MKRCFTWILNRFVQWVKSRGLKYCISHAICAIIVIALGMTGFVFADKVPATESDYEPLEKQMTAVQQNPSVLLQPNCTGSIKDGVMTVEFKNDECKLVVQYGQNFEIVSTSRKDFFKPWQVSLVFYVLWSVLLYLFIWRVAVPLLYES